MFQVLPVELVEEILLYLTVIDIYNCFQAFGRNYNILSEHFWRKVCLNDDFLRVYDHLEWFECFESGISKRLCNFTHCHKPPVGKLEHVHSKSIIVCDSKYNVYSLNSRNNFELVQSMPSSPVYFKDEFVVTECEQKIIIKFYRYNWESNKFDVFTKLDETLEEDVFRISSKYCAIFQTKKKLIKVYSLCDKTVEYTVLQLPKDVKFLIEKILHKDNIVISAVTLDGYRIKVYDIVKSEWVLDLQCFTSTGITNDPNVWVGDNFIACCDVSYRLRGIYFGPFKIWNKKGEKVVEAEIDPSNQHYLRCFFKDQHVLLTTSDNRIQVFVRVGSHLSNINTKTTFQDIKLSTGFMLFVLMKEMPSVEIHNWKTSCHLYSFPLTFTCSNSFLSEFLYCPCNNDKYEVFKLS